jgi:hypothetical protein
MDLMVNDIIHNLLGNLTNITDDWGPRGGEGAGPMWLRLLTEKYYKVICQSQWHKSLQNHWF